LFEKLKVNVPITTVIKTVKIGAIL